MSESLHQFHAPGQCVAWLSEQHQQPVTQRLDDTASEGRHCLLSHCLEQQRLLNSLNVALLPCHFRIANKVHEGYCRWVLSDRSVKSGLRKNILNMHRYILENCIFKKAGSE